MFQGKKVLIYGKGRVGTALKKFCEYHKISAEIKDDSDIIDGFDEYDVIIPSPGISPSHKIYTTGKIVGELDFVYAYLPKNFKIISITGTDGKSTTAWILYNLLKQEYGEGKVFLSGNFEIPFAETVQTIQERSLKNGYIILEVSSFMAYNIQSFQSTHSIFTNFETDHLNWHSNLQDYFNSKIRLFEHTIGTSLINEQVFSRAKEFGLALPKDIPNVRVFGVEILPTVIVSETKQSRMQSEKDEIAMLLHSSQWQKTPVLKDKTDGKNIIVSGQKKYLLNETRFSGMHNAINILSCVLVANVLKICSKRTREYLKDISGLPHRLELVTTRNEVRFIDDSKSTSAQSLIAALDSFGDQKICLIAGGSDKWDSFEHLGQILAKKVKHAELIGATQEILGKICEQQGVPYHSSESMDEAVCLSAKTAKSGDVILLSPGCASFGMFRDYLDRAEKFRRAVEKLDFM
ncbi:MAG: UDP-N-acetylmuramoylalanine-D-glutamate ligase [uncultured bacterium (gcode 4)]|uniref:UDP-N-acetylmuramoylalanine--D-glutamate ligase n=1 Tax=uncultured bacterium (gcode 4) TaxID=1234023 RepID=K1XID7_9BACT|nr:MAG: UDP-N-acetylmuramoylalanine-D-glutamate ligase [uncultured bacterium (gcode 4)]